MPNPAPLRFLLPACLLALAAALAQAQDKEPETPSGEPLFKIYCWDNYFAADTLANFEKEAGMKVELKIYDSNEELEEKLTSGLLVGVDVIFPSDYEVKRLSDKNQLAKLDLKKIPNVSNLWARFLKLPYDRTNQYSVPYMWGTTGVAVNRTKVSGNVESLAILFDEKYKGKITMLDSARTCLGMVLKYLGKSANTKNKADIEAAKQVLLKQKPLVLRYANDKYTDGLLNGTTLIALGYNGDVLRARATNKGIFYQVPQEGSLLWTDNLCILKNSDHIELAHKFIDYLLRPEVSAAITNETFFASPNEPAQKLVKPEILKDRTIFPSQKVLDKSEFIENLGTLEEMYEKAWKEVTGGD